MVLKSFTHLARQTFTKSITHGYAQSVVAATQPYSTTQFSAFSNHPLSRYGKQGTLQHREVYQNASASSSTIKRSNHTSSSADAPSDGSLDAYFAAWQKQQRAGGEIEWQQFPFQKRIGWKPSPPVVESKGKEKDDGGLRSEAGLDRNKQDVDLTHNAETAIPNETTAKGEITGSTHDDAIVSDETSGAQKSFENVHQSFIFSKDVSTEVVPVSQLAANQSSESSSMTAKSSSPTTSMSDQTAFTNSQSPGALSTHDAHLTELQTTRKYVEIPPVFEGMLRAGLLPSATAYNALLTAAIHIPTNKHQVVSKVMNVYSDMLRRNVLPTTETYTILIDFLSSRALEISLMRSNLNVERLRFGGMKEAGRFMFRSHEAEHDILAEDNTLSVALKLFSTSTAASQPRIYGASTYRLLLNAAAAYGEVDHMIKIYAHMEANKIVPFASVYPSMIQAFAVSGDLRSAVECYNEYKTLAISDNNGETTLLTREDNAVYAAVVKSYAICGKHDGALRFYGKIVASLTDAGVPTQQVDSLRDAVVLDALVKAHLETNHFAEALKAAEEGNMTVAQQNQAMIRICAAAADNNDVEIANKAYQHTTSSTQDSSTATIAMLAMHIRRGDVESAQSIWSTLTSISKLTNAFIQPTAMYTIALIGSGNVDEGLMQARQLFTRIRTVTNSSDVATETTEQIDESIELIGSFLAEKGILPSAQASMSFMWAMVENGGLISRVAEQLLAGLGPANVSNLSWQDLTLALQVEAGIVINAQSLLDVAHNARFHHLLETSLNSNMPLDERTSVLVQRCLTKIGHQRPDLIARWQALQVPSAPPVLFTSQQAPVLVAPPTYNDTYDPYAPGVDHRGSAAIIEELEKQGSRSASNLTEALMRFRNIRRAGRHPRYVVYAKLITAAAKDGRGNLIHEILEMAKQDIPLMPQHSVVRHGWITIFDAMVGACLTLGNRRMAGVYHQELLEMGAAPSANTFGLYITTLKETAKTYDEATEAVKIFQRAVSEGVEPSSFLYNALIGKLGKARRIDDCLFYFTQMRDRGIRPTSVTYGTIVNALCRVSDERFAQELFDEMELMPNYKPRPAPYNSLMQYFLTTKRDSSKVLEYYQRMQSRKIQPTMHTYKLLIDTYATLEPINLAAAEGVLDMIRASGQQPEAVHYASLIHAKGCALHDMPGARQLFDKVLRETGIRPQASLYQALFESMVANHCVRETGFVLNEMAANGVEMTPYIANTLIHGWAMEKDITAAEDIYFQLSKDKKEPSTYEAMTRAFLAVEDRESASAVAQEMLSRGYPSAVSEKVLELLRHGMPRSGAAPSSATTPIVA